MACSVQRGESHIVAQDASAIADMTFIDAGVSDEPLSLSGNWLLFTEDRRCIYPDLGDRVENIVWTYYLVSFSTSEDNAPSLGLEAELCHQVLSPLPYGFLTVVPRAVTTTLTPIKFAGFLVGRTPGSSFVTERATDMWGYQDDDPTAPLPESGDDERVFDQDGDGLPGVTLQVETPQGGSICEVRVVQRTTLQCEGSVVNNRLIEGPLNVIPEEIVLSASTSLCAGGRLRASSAGNRFELFRLPEDLSDCDAVYNQLDRVRELLRIPEQTPDELSYCPEMIDE